MWWRGVQGEAGTGMSGGGPWQTRPERWETRWALRVERRGSLGRGRWAGERGPGKARERESQGRGRGEEGLVQRGRGPSPAASCAGSSAADGGRLGNGPASAATEHCAASLQAARGGRRDVPAPSPSTVVRGSTTPSARALLPRVSCTAPRRPRNVSTTLSGDGYQPRDAPRLEAPCRRGGGQRSWRTARRETRGAGARACPYRAGCLRR